ncbi:30S ribosomal protein S3 [Candidatus Omnitrophota bacterium]
MGQKVHPYGLRVGYIFDWKSRWFANKKEFPGCLIEDRKIRDFVKKSLSTAAVSKIEIERTTDKVRLIIFSARPGIIIGRRGSEIERLKESLESIVNKDLVIDIKEIKRSTLDAQLVSENIAFQMEKRIPFRRAMKKSIQATLDAGGQGIKIICSGRLGGAEIARTESYRVGKIPCQTLRANIDYGFAEARTTYGAIGVKVWIYTGDMVLDKLKEEEADTRRGPAARAADKTR